MLYPLNVLYTIYVCGIFSYLYNMGLLKNNLFLLMCDYGILKRERRKLASVPLVHPFCHHNVLISYGFYVLFVRSLHR